MVGRALIGTNATFNGNITLNGAVTRNINFYNDTNSILNAQIQYDQISSNTGQLFFGTNNAGTFATRLTIASTGAATFSSSVTVNSNVDIVNYTTGSSLFVGGAATNGVSNGIMLLQSGRIPQSGSDTTGTNGLLFQHTISNATNVNGGYIYNGRETVFGSAGSVNTFISFATTLANTNNEQMRITSSGTIGIGNNNPKTFAGTTLGALQVGTSWVGTFAASSSFGTILGNNVYFNTDWKRTLAQPVSFIQFNEDNFYFANAVTGSADSTFTPITRMAITSSGNVGIGTASPGSLLDISGSDSTSLDALRLRNTNSTSGGLTNLSFYNYVSAFGGTTGRAAEICSLATNFSNTGSASLLFKTTDNITNVVPTERMRITSSGNVLIGTTTDNGAKFQVSGTATVTGQMQQEINQLRSSNGTQAVSSTGDIFRFLNIAGGVNNGYYSAIFHIYVYDNNTGANSYSATYAVQTTSNGQTDFAFTVLASVVRGSNPVSSINLVSDGGGGAAKIRMTTTATPTAGATYYCSAIGIF